MGRPHPRATGISAALALVLGCRASGPATAPQTPLSPPTSEPVVPPGGLVFSGERPRNLLLVSFDTTRRDRVGFTSGRSTTPSIDTLLAGGVRLTDHRSCSNWTAPSMVCATTGFDPMSLGFWPGSGNASVADTPDDLATLAALWGAAGGDSALVSGNQVFSAGFGPGQGYATEVVRDYAPAEEVLAEGVTQLDRMAAGSVPWLLHVHFMDPHREYCPPASYRPTSGPDVGFDLCADLRDALDAREEHDAAWEADLLAGLQGLYDGELRYADSAFASLWSEVEVRGLDDDVLLVWFTDHGEQQLERGLVDHGFTLYAEENRAAAGFWARTLEPATWDGPTLHQDLAATLLDLFALGGATDGVPLGAAPMDRVRRILAYSELDYGPPQLGVVVPGGVLQYAWDGARSYHDTVADPAEREDVYDPESAEVLAAWGPMAELVDEVAATWPHLGAPVDAAP